MADLYGLTPSPEELDQFAGQRNHINLNYGQANATNLFQRGNTLANKQADYGNLKRQFVQQRAQIPGQFIGRGLLNSGLYQRGLKDYAANRTEAFGDLGRKYQQMLGTLDLQRQQGAASQFADLADVNAQERQRRAELAAQIRSL